MIELILSLLSPSTVLILIVLFLLTHYIRQMPSMRNMPPGPFPLPVVGSLIGFREKPGNGLNLYDTLAKKYGKLCSLKLGSVNTLIISDYDLLLEAFVKNADVYSDRPKDIFYVMKEMNEQLGPGIVTNDGHSWKQLRRIAAMTMRDFGYGKKSLEEKVQDETSILLECFGQKKSKPFNVKHLFDLASSNIICGVIFGSRFDYDDDKFIDLLKHLERSLSVNAHFMPVNYMPFLKHIPYFIKDAKTFNERLYKTTEYVQELAASHEPTFDPDNIRDFVDVFIKMKREHNVTDGSYNERNMCRVIIEMFVSGSDTTARTLTWLMLYMAKHPDVQTKCQKEIDEVVGKGKGVTMADKDKMKYVEATTIEALRMKPPRMPKNSRHSRRVTENESLRFPASPGCYFDTPVIPFWQSANRPVSGSNTSSVQLDGFHYFETPGGVPHCTNKESQLGGYFIPKDTLVYSNLVTIQNDPEIFPDPTTFKPEHFLDKDGNIINKERMVAFSVGPRSCLGEILAKMELFIFFASIIQFYTITPDPGIPIDLTTGDRLSPKPQNIVFNRRD